MLAFEIAKKQNGSVKYQEFEVALRFPPHLELNNGIARYESCGIDQIGNNYKIIWKITHDDYMSCENEDEMCDWEDYSIMKY